NNCQLSIVNCQLSVNCSSGCFVPVGGGKDSIVTLELLRESREFADDNLCYIVGDIKRAFDSAKTAGFPDSRIIGVKREISPALLELNKRPEYFNGHTPFSAVVAFSSLIFAYLTGKKYIVLSNESSADEGNVGGSEINHQYSKSTEFERDFRDYVQRLGQNFGGVTLPEYFSLLRPWNELQIVRKFVQYPKYFPVFQSCNAGTKSNIWCCKCAKCLYVCIMLSAFVDSESVNKVFGGNLLDNPELRDLLYGLANPATDKPFECVGTKEEVNFALYTILNNSRDVPLLLREYADKVEVPKSDLLNDFNEAHFVPKAFVPLLRR
ncbi:MAG: hypothetical protein FWF82_02360, partial [Oscillospiraceae bacterium]|nr:hypothetical protein [Oscillospiraceae bacterium]